MQALQPIRFGHLILDPKTAGLSPEWTEALLNTTAGMPTVSNAITSLGNAGIDVFISFDREQGLNVAHLRIQDREGASLMGAKYPNEGIKRKVGPSLKDYSKVASDLLLEALSFGIIELASRKKK